MGIESILFLVGRILFGGYFLLSGVNHFSKRRQLTGYAASRGVPYPGAAVALSGLLILLGGLGVLLGAYVRWSLVLLLLFLVPVTFKMHAYWADQDPGMKAGNQVNFMKNLALTGAALMLFALPLPWAWSFLPF